MKRLLYALTALLVAGACFAAGQKEAAAASAGIVNPAGTFPIVKEKITLRVAMENQGAPDYDTNWFTKYLEGRTNIQVKWELLPYDKSMEKALGYLKNQTTYLKILGSYPRSNPRQPIRLDREQIRSLAAQPPRLSHEVRD